MWGFMVRFSVIALSLILLSNASLAPSNLGEKIRIFPDVVLVEDMEDFHPWESPRVSPAEFPKLTPGDCRRYGARYGYPECAPYRPPLPREKDKLPSVAVKPPVPNVLAKKVATRNVNEQERKPPPAKPATSSLAAVSPKPEAVASGAPNLAAIAGQLLLVAFEGKAPTDAGVVRIGNLLRDGKISGVIVSDSNIVSFPQLRELIASIIRESGNNSPIIALDQPGGPDSSLPEEKGFTFYSAANFVSNDQAPSGAQLFYRDMASELAALGVTLNFGPSADACREEGVNLSASCFGTSPSRIKAFAAAFSAGHHDRGVLTALRHGPFNRGLEMSVLGESASAAILHAILKREAADALLVRRKAMDPLPPPPSAFALSNRKTQSSFYRAFGFRGAVICDLDMQAVGPPARYGEAIVRAFEGGADMVLLRDASFNPGEVSAVTLEAMLEGLKSGRLEKARIEDAYAHVMRMKSRLRAVHPKLQIAHVER